MALVGLRDLATECITSGYNRVVNVGKALTPTQLTWQPASNINHAGFLVFHTFRVLDRHFHRQLSLQGELWERNKWNRHFPLPPEPPNAMENWSTGNGWTDAHVAAFQVPLIDQLLAYGDSVFQSAMRKLQTLDLSDLEQQSTDPVNKLTSGTILTRACVHPMQHAGQLDYLVGLMKQQGVQ